MSDDKVLTKTQKSTPVFLLKQLRATAALMCYDYIFGLPTMPNLELQRKIYNMYHGSSDLNMISQVDLMCEGKGNYKNLYNSIQTIVTNNDKILTLTHLRRNR